MSALPINQLRQPTHSARLRSKRQLSQLGLKEEINRLAHLKMQQSFAVLRMRMEDQACELLETGKSRSEVLQELMNEFFK